MLQMFPPKTLEELGYPDYGRIAYEAYCKRSGGKSLVSGQDLPAWHDLNWEIASAWQESASAVMSKLRGYEAVPFCPNRSRTPGETRYSVTLTEEGFQQMLGIPWNHRLVSVEHNHGSGFVTAYYELVTPLITSYGGMDVNRDTETQH